jgi:hypothetical protein
MKYQRILKTRGAIAMDDSLKHSLFVGRFTQRLAVSQENFERQSIDDQHSNKKNRKCLTYILSRQI